MNEAIFTIFLLTTIGFNPTLGRPGLLNQQRYEFQDFHTSSSQDHNARLEVATIPEQHEPILWSQQHQNEVNAFAEIFRQTYNQMVEQHNERMQMAHHALTNSFMPVTYVLYDVPNEGFWRNYFGNQQQYVYHQTELMSRQLIQELEEGRISPQEMMNPNFFVAQAAHELNRVHHAQNEFRSNDQQVASISVNTYQQHHFDTLDDQQQQQHQIFAETHHLAEDSKQAQEYNQKAGEYQFVTVVAASEKPQYEELAGEITSNANVQHLSYIQRLPPVTFNNEKLNRFSQEVEHMEGSPRLSQQHLNEEVNKPLDTAVDEFYGSTYDQQPIYDMQFVENVSSTVKPSMVNVMSLVRNKTKVKPSTTTSAPATTTSTTATELPTRESSIMSLLPNKKPSFNYKDIAQKVRAELDKQMKNTHNNKSEETHFMGMSSNIDHVKLSYDTIIDAKDHKESRGDQPSKIDDYIYEEYVESETNTYSVHTEPEPGLVVSTVSVKSPSSTLSPITSTATQIRVSSNPLNPNPFIPFSTTTTKLPNPYYSAPLAPFPDNIWQVKATAQSQAEHFIDHSNDSHFVVAATNHGLNEQHYEDILEHHEEFHISHDMQQYEDVQQTYIDIAGGHEMTGQRYEQQLPPEQEYRDPYSQHSVAGLNGNSHIPAHVQEITPATVEHKTQKNNWFQQKLSKFKNLF